MTAEEFERAYAERSGTTVEQLRALGRIVAPCDCGDAMCEGWQSTTAERLADKHACGLPARCADCNAPLQGGATIHAADCWIYELISRNFPEYVRS